MDNPKENKNNEKPKTNTDSNSDTENDTTTQTIDAVNKTSVRLPQFYERSPETWFIVAEAQFSQRRLSDDRKFNHVLESLPESIVVSVVDVIKFAPQGNRYETLKRALLDRLGLSEEQKLNQLLTNVHDIGDLKPSDYYRKLENQVGNSEMINPRLLKNFWLKRLPEDLRTAIAAWSNSDIKDILPIADTIWTFTNKSVYSVAATEQHSHHRSRHNTTHRNTTTSLSNNPGPSTSTDSTLKELERKIDQLASQVAKLSTENYRLRRQRSRTPRRGRSNSRGRNKDYCYYHDKFGNAAKNCRSPCSFKPPISSNSNTPN